MTASLIAPSGVPTVADATAQQQAASSPSKSPKNSVDVMFPLMDDEEWPPYPAEMIEAELLSHDLVEITGVPWFATNLSRGDIVAVSQDGIGYVGGRVVSRGGHSTAHVLAGSQQEMAPIAEALRQLGAEVSSGFEPPMLAVDVPPQSSLDEVVAVLAAAESMTCAYTVACGQHRGRVARAS